MEHLVLTVSQLNTYVKSLLDQNEHLHNVFIVGEISNFTDHYRSGHLYMSLKDDTALIRAVMFRSSAEKLKFTPEDGMRVLVRGRVSLYDRDGQYQLYIDDMQPDGIGALSIAFGQLKERLAQEGLFSAEHKLPLPAYPEKIGVITSPTGAAVQDIFNVLSRRYPAASIIFCPVKVQGDGAAEEMIRALKVMESHHAANVIIIGRGGGSMEDLWQFNSEALARTIYSMTIPVVSAVGHETDYTICDFVSDMRAPTPSAAAELVSPEQLQLLAYVRSEKASMLRALNQQLADKKSTLLSLSRCRAFSQPEYLSSPFQQRFDRAGQQFRSAVIRAEQQYSSAFAVLSERLTAYSPLSVLGRGYALALTDGKVLKTAEQVRRSGQFTLQMSDGTVECTVRQHSAQLN